MSLIGSLEDLSLGDILQIINLSQKSGVLSVRSDQGEGRIVFREGLVRAAVVKGGPSDLRDVLVGGEFLSAEVYDAAAIEARAGDPESAMAQHCGLPPERIASLAREAVEASVVQMFRWQTGEFSFDLRVQPEPDDPQIFLSLGINAQYLAMEGTRLCDEASASDSDRQGRDPDEAVAEPVGAPGIGELLGSPHLADVGEAELVSEQAAPRAQTRENSPAQPGPPESVAPLVVIDGDLRGLEWVKEVLSDWERPIHIFQRAELGLVRIRQYLARAEHPLVLISPESGADPLTGIKDGPDFVRRLKVQSPRIRVLWLCEDGGEPLGELRPADGVVVRPSRHHFASTRGQHRVEELSRALQGNMEALSRGDSLAAEPIDPRAISNASLTRLKDVTGRLRDSSVRGDVLPFVLRFAAESFSRVALFMVREDGIFGIAQSGMIRAGGPDDEGLRQIQLQHDQVGWFKRVLGARRPLRSAPTDSGDRELCSLLGDIEPEEAFVAPIESSGRVVALLYGDPLPDGGRVGDTSALEVVLQHAGLALDRAALKRALDEFEERPKPLEGESPHEDASETRPKG